MMNYTVLVAEDDVPLADVLADILEDEGYKVRCVADGEAALKEVEHAPPDLVISDISMPRMDGISVAKRVLAMRPPIPIILMSAKRLPQVVPGARFVPKPFDVDHLLMIASRALAASKRNHIID